MENKFKLYDEVELLVDQIEGRDFISSYHENYHKGSVGIVIEVISDDAVMIELSSTEYKNPVITAKTTQIKKIK